ncbi:threonylcarbamoyladenosine tRNA methylthiotransferase MtaB [Carboxydocella thermautotrophica]|nr:threonylcarbamoyladenosine tRNA methylthiotransferase MtaB [Carboxydocella thermautotrophica]
MAERTVAFATLGCKTNQYESEAMASLFRQAGYQVVDFEQPADVYIINTCSVTHLSNRKSRQLIRRAARRGGLVVVTGCYAQTAPGEVLAIEGVDLVVGTRDRQQLVQLVEEARAGTEPLARVENIMEAAAFEEIAPVLEEGRARAFVKIQEGCNNFCSYCIIPYARGPQRSREPARVLAEIQALVERGYQEVVLTGICIGAYGREGGEGDLAWLVEKICRETGICRLRLGSIEPTDLTPALLEIMADYPQVCPHLHIPLQSGCDVTLREMNRHYSTYEYARLLGVVREFLPQAAITTDVIVGFPGESGEHFAATKDFISQMGFARLHVFPYSPRQGTPAAERTDQVPAAVKEKRVKELNQLGRQLARNYGQRFLETIQAVLVEQEYKDGFWEGLTANYLRVLLPARPEERGQLISVRLIGWRGDYLVGERL